MASIKGSTSGLQPKMLPNTYSAMYAKLHPEGRMKMKRRAWQIMIVQKNSRKMIRIEKGL